MNTRRSFIKSVVMEAGAAAWAPRCMRADALRLPLGLQLYSVREMLPKDYPGTLKQVAALGYREVEAAGFYGRAAAEVKEAMRQAGLRCVSAHYSAADLFPKVDAVIEYAQALGLEWIVCSFPAIKDMSRLADKSYEGQVRSFTLEDWRYNAEKFDEIGGRVKAAGMRFAYHNHTMEFRETEGVVPFEELLRLTDPAKVWIELDCGWVVVGGGNPEEILRKHAARIRMLHVKDFKAIPAQGGGEPVPSELGRGAIDNRKILAAARGVGIRHCFVEQEAFDVPWVESLEIDAEFMGKA
jgi:sugar phosphate isomerase/epimerase